MSAARLVSLNIEHAKHLSRVIPFLRETDPDIVCLQELNEPDIPCIAEALGYENRIYAPMTRFSHDAGPRIVSGIGIFSHRPAITTRVDYYWGEPGSVVDFDETDVDTKMKTEKFAVVSCEVEHNSSALKVAMTHFIWTPKGDADDYQREGARRLLAILNGYGEFVLCGDFNAPRVHKGAPGEIYTMFASRYKDNIPLEYETSIDVTLHRSGKLRPEELADKMVDQLFTTPAYRADNVQLISGVSDHMAIVADVSRA